MTFLRPTLSELIARNRSDIETRLPGADSQMRHSVLDVLARMHGGASAGMHGYLDFIAKQLMPDTAEAEYLARWASIWGIVRKGATAAIATATATGTPGAIIPNGAQLLDPRGKAYLVLETATLLATGATLRIEAVEPGPDGDLPAGAALTFSSAISGVTAQAAVLATEQRGTDQETDDSLLVRLLARIRKPPQGGALHDYVAWALAQPGVTRAWANARWMGAGTVGLSFVMDGRADILPLVADIAAVQSALDELRPVTAELVVFAPQARPIDVVFRLNPDTPAVRDAVVAELKDFFARDAQPGGTIYLSRLREAISLAQGEFSHALELPDADITVGPAQMPMLGSINFS